MEPEELKAALASGQKAAARAAGAGKNIASAAADRLEVVHGSIRDIGTKAITDPGAEKQYLDLSMESGQLSRVVAGNKEA